MQRGHVTAPKDAAGIARAYLEHRYSQQEIADYLGVHYSTVSRRLRASRVPRTANAVRDRCPCVNSQPHLTP
ncbi:MAG: helix-turn-helix transcriptional regulator [Candidatus Bipolaricaulota bacterium]